MARSTHTIIAALYAACELTHQPAGKHGPFRLPTPPPPQPSATELKRQIKQREGALGEMTWISESGRWYVELSVGAAAGAASVGNVGAAQLRGFLYLSGDAAAAALLASAAGGPAAELRRKVAACGAAPAPVPLHDAAHIAPTDVGGATRPTAREVWDEHRAAQAGADRVRGEERDVQLRHVGCKVREKRQRRGAPA
eukprot:gene45197-8410_t